MAAPAVVGWPGAGPGFPEPLVPERPETVVTLPTTPPAITTERMMRFPVSLTNTYVTPLTAPTASPCGALNPADVPVLLSASPEAPHVPAIVVTAKGETVLITRMQWFPLSAIYIVLPAAYPARPRGALKLALTPAAAFVLPFVEPEALIPHTPAGVVVAPPVRGNLRMQLLSVSERYRIAALFGSIQRPWGQ